MLTRAGGGAEACHTSEKAHAPEGVTDRATRANDKRSTEHSGTRGCGRREAPLHLQKRADARTEGAATTGRQTKQRGGAYAGRGRRKACLTSNKADADEGWERHPPQDKPSSAEGRMLTRAEGRGEAPPHLQKRADTRRGSRNHPKTNHAVRKGGRRRGQRAALKLAAPPKRLTRRSRRRTERRMTGGEAYLTEA